MKTKLPPHSSFNSKSPRITRALEDWIIARLFWPNKLIKINDKGEINFSHEGIGHTYQLFEPQKFFAHKNSRVIVHFSEEYPDTAFIFSEQNKEFIAQVEARPIWTKEAPEIRHKYVGKKNKIHAYLKRMRNADRILAEADDQIYMQSRMDNLSRRLNKKLMTALLNQNDQYEKEENEY